MSTMRVIINDDEPVDVDADSQDNFFLSTIHAVNDAAFKCGGCHKVTVHSGIEINVRDLNEPVEADTAKHRYYVCTNCGKFGKR